MGVDATRADTAGDFCAALERALTEPGPHLIDAIL
jgi:acetolactate synthase-1/2/3 large subunit